MPPDGPSGSRGGGRYGEPFDRAACTAASAIPVAALVATVESFFRFGFGLPADDGAWQEEPAAEAELAPDHRVPDARLWSWSDVHRHNEDAKWELWRPPPWADDDLLPPV